MKIRKTRQGTPYLCQSKATYLALEAFNFIACLVGGGAAISGGRWYLIEARQLYEGKFSLNCKSRIGFRVDESQVFNKSSGLQEKLLHSYMDLKIGSPIELPGLLIEQALLPALCSIKDVFPEVLVTPGQAITIRARKSTRWEIPEDVVDETYSILTKEAYRLVLAFKQIESSPIVDG